METLEPSERVTHCPFKGKATYFDLNAQGNHLRDAVWTVRDALRRTRGTWRSALAFDADAYPVLHIQVGD